MPKIPITDITIGRRYRQDFKDLESLAEQIKEHGLIHPITVDKDYNLICGERRLRAHVFLGLKEIEAIIREEDLTLSDRRVLEISENLHHHDFTWAEEITAIRDLHLLKVSEKGQAVKGVEGSGWGLKETADFLKISIGKVHKAIETARWLDMYPEAAKSDSITGAIKYIKEAHLRKLLAEDARRKAARGSVVLNEVAPVVPLERTTSEIQRPVCINDNCVPWLASHIKDPLFSLFFIDPPYGVDADKISAVAKTFPGHYKDPSGLEWMQKTYDMLKECYRVATPAAHCYLFFSITTHTVVEEGAVAYNEDWFDQMPMVTRLIKDAGWDYDRMPIIWVKGKGGATAGRSFEYDWLPCYEPILFLRKGKGRPFNEGHRYNRNAITEIKPVHGSRKVHPAEKPVELYDFLCRRSGTVGGMMLDPCAGSGNSVVACAKLLMHTVAIEEDPNTFTLMVANIGKKLELGGW